MTAAGTGVDGGSAFTAELLPDLDVARAFYGALFRHADPKTYISIRAFDDLEDGKRPLFSESITVGDRLVMDTVAERMRQAANHPRPHVFCPPVATFISAKDAKTKNLANGLAISVECDAEPERAQKILTALLGEPTIVVASGGQWLDPATGQSQSKLHLHWRLKVPTAAAAEHAALREARELATRLVGGDATSKSIVHPMRWPGSWHRKGQPRLARIIASSETELDLAEALELLRGTTASQEPTAAATSQAGLRADDMLEIVAALAVIPNDDLHWDDWNRIGMATWNASDGRALPAFDAWSQKSPKYDAEATAARWRHYATSPPDRIGAGTLFFEADKIRPGWRRVGRPSPAVPKSGKRNGAAAPDDHEAEGIEMPAPTNPASRRSGAPTIRIVAGELHKIATEAEAALIAFGAPFYVFSGGIVRPIVDEVDAARGRKTKTARLAPVTGDVMLDYLSRAATWEKWNVRKQEWAPADPPKAVAATVLARDGEWTFPQLAGVITTPTLRPDGSILDQPGYDITTRLLLLDPPHMPHIPARPTRDDALDALRLLDDLLGEFSFVDEASRSVALSALITPVARGAMSVAPLHAMRAPSAGSGKSYLVDLASAIGTGQRCPVIAAGRDEAETEKRLGAALMAGYPIISIDNLNGELGGDALCQAIERPVVSIRVLGFSDLKRVESRATMFATGNNIQPTGDVVRRVLLCSLDPDVERPEQRQFHTDPLEKILSDRGRYVAAALTIVRAYAVAGQPEPRQALASFDEWSLKVRSALVWLDKTDPVNTMETAREEDPQLASFRAVVSTWAAACGSTAITTGELKALADATIEPGPEGKAGHKLHPELHRALIEVAGTRGMIDPKRLGHFLSRHAGGIADGMKLVGETDGHRKQKVWSLRRVKAGMCG